MNQALQHLEATRRAFEDWLGYLALPDHLRPHDRLVWMAFTSPREMGRYAQQADRFDPGQWPGYYSARTNVVALVIPPHDPPPIVSPHNAHLAHEAAHQLAFNYGLQRRGVMYPLWVSEGLATCFEPVGRDSAAPWAVNRDRLRALRYAFDRGMLAPLHRMAGATRVPADPLLASDAYGQCWAFFRFARLHRPEQLRLYLALSAEADPGRVDRAALTRRFFRAFGDRRALEADWRRYIHALCAPTLH